MVGCGDIVDGCAVVLGAYAETVTFSACDPVSDLDVWRNPGAGLVKTGGKCG